MMRPWHVAAVFAGCLALGLAAAIWITVTASNVATQAQEKAALEENVRVALWRMESALAPLVSRESARSHVVYQAFYSPANAYDTSFNAYAREQVQVASPLASETSPDIRLHFQIDPRGNWSSPQVPSPDGDGVLANMRALISGPASSGAESARQNLTALRSRIDPQSLIASLPPAVEALPAITSTQPQPQVAAQTAQVVQIGQSERNLMEQQQRARQSWNDNRQQVAAPDLGDDALVGAMHATWLADELILARRVLTDSGEFVQGCWLEWTPLRTRLIEQISDLFPEAQLAPARDTASDPSRTLVALPVRLVPGATAVAVQPANSPLKLSLWIAWSAMGLAALAIAGLLLGTLALSERRAAFVSAVTHELRTPLTTFQLYTDLLAQGGDAAKSRSYAATLGGESRRLSHLVENVLTYARLERGRSPATLENVELPAFLERLRPLLEQRLAQAGLSLALHCSPELASQPIRTDPAAMERILLNLADNAAKYAADSEPRIVRIDLDRAGRNVLIRFRDYGPGIPTPVRRTIFRPFARHSKNTAPGVGLGLALSRRLARHVGGDLRLDRTIADGAGFVLTLPGRAG